MPTRSDGRRIISHLVEFFFVGLVMGVTEDLIAIKFATDTRITWHVFWVAFWVALPFAIISELLVDAPVIRRRIKSFFRKKA